MKITSLGLIMSVLHGAGRQPIFHVSYHAIWAGSRSTSVLIILSFVEEL
jgi:hypothetical protein